MPIPPRLNSEHNRLVPVQQDAALDVPADRSGQNYFLQITAFLNELFNGIAVRDACDVLLDDGTIIEDFGDVVASCADEFYATVEGLMIGLRPNECRQERMVNIDDPPGIGLDEIIRENLHVAREDDEVDFVAIKLGANLGLGCLLIVPIYGDKKKWNAVEVGDALTVGVVRQNARNLAG